MFGFAKALIIESSFERLVLFEKFLDLWMFLGMGLICKRKMRDRTVTFRFLVNALKTEH